MTALFGARTTEQLLPMSLDVSVDDVPLRLTGLVSKPTPGAGRSSGDRQYFYVNRRPWDARKLAQVFNQVYKTYNVAQYPCVVANLEVAPDQYDVNVSPDKRTILVHHEARLLETIRVRLSAHTGSARCVLCADTRRATGARPGRRTSTAEPRRAGRAARSTRLGAESFCRRRSAGTAGACARKRGARQRRAHFANDMSTCGVLTAKTHRRTSASVDRRTDFTRGRRAATPVQAANKS